MSRDKTVTAFQFLEEIQRRFITEMEGSSEASYETRRMINFFDNTATLHVMNGSNGSADPLAILRLQGVSAEEETPTFAVNIGVKPFEKQQKFLVLLNSEQVLQQESGRILGLLRDDISKAGKEEEAAPASSPAASSGGIGERRARSSSIGSSSAASDAPAEEGSAASRLRRRASLRNREENAE